MNNFSIYTTNIPQKKRVYVARKLHLSSPTNIYMDTTTNLNNFPKMSSKIKINNLPLEEEEQEENEEDVDWTIKSPKIKKINVFDQTNYIKKLIPEFDELNRGPRFDKNGSLIPYSLIGKAETFLIIKKEEEEKLKNKRIKFAEGSINFGRRMSKKPSMCDDVFDYKAKKSIITSNVQKVFCPINKKLLSKNELLAELDKKTARRLDTLRDEYEKLNSLQKEEKRVFTKEERILTKYKFYENFWENQSDSIKVKINKTGNKTLLNDTENWRKIIETHEVFNLAKSDSDRLGKNLWSLSLRSYDNQKREPIEIEEKIKIFDDLPKAFGTTILGRRKNYVEKIRKPGKKLTETSNLYTSFTSSFYFNQEIERKKIKIKTDGEDLENLEVKYNFNCKYSYIKGNRMQQIRSRKRRFIKFRD